MGFLLGGLAGPAGAIAGATAGAAFGSRVVSGAMVKTSPQAMKKFERISEGVYYVAKGRELERQSKFNWREQDRYIQELMLANAATDAMSAFRLASGAEGAGSLLDMIMGGTKSTGEGLFGRWTPRAGEF